MTDREAIDRVRGGEPAAFEEIIRRHHSRVFQLAYRLVWNGAEAEDIVQEVFMNCFKSLGRYDGREDFSPWLYTIAVNTARTHLRSSRRRGFPAPLTEEAPDVTNPSPEQNVLGMIELEEVQRALLALSPDQRLTLTLRAVEGLSYSDIAAQTKCSLGTVMSRLNRARTRLREVLEGRNP